MKKQYISLLITIIFLTFLFIIYFLITGNTFPCIIKIVTGYYCPGCGFTRMIICLFKLDFYQAFRFNPYLFCFVILLPFIILIEILLRNKKDLLKKITIFIFILFSISFLSFGIIRNLDAFSYLLPTIVKL